MQQLQNILQILRQTRSVNDSNFRARFKFFALKSVYENDYSVFALSFSHFQKNGFFWVRLRGKVMVCGPSWTLSKARQRLRRPGPLTSRGQPPLQSSIPLRGPSISSSRETGRTDLKREKSWFGLKYHQLGSAVVKYTFSTPPLKRTPFLKVVVFQKCNRFLNNTILPRIQTLVCN
ncbi:Hypothetical_protein [Hexamita inflata]|uniref:Hypothetical_protein n=1 Tax=Hexamita inflata TaxID=28002 RepID=A0AA86NGS5_9EUKA|nr:Hypothetical protein HINF_LOCUS6469 [Hexamita inflata]